MTLSFDLGFLAIGFAVLYIAASFKSSRDGGQDKEWYMPMLFKYMFLLMSLAALFQMFSDYAAYSWLEVLFAGVVFILVLLLAVDLITLIPAVMLGFRKRMR
jgi:cell division protein FtsW (lipid II flippase)